MPGHLFFLLRCIILVTVFQSYGIPGLPESSFVNGGTNHNASLVLTKDTPVMTWYSIALTAGYGVRWDFAVAVWKDMMYLTGGWSSSGLYADVWGALDGLSWSEITPNAGFPERGVHGSIGFGDSLLVIGGLQGTVGYYGSNDIWRSVNGGLQWDEVTKAARFPHRYSFGLTIFKSQLWIAGGANELDYVNDVWYSSDGKNWMMVTANARFSPQQFPSLIVFNDKLWVIDGNNDVFSSIDGQTWFHIAPTAPFTQKGYRFSIIFNNLLYTIFGWQDGDNYSRREVWYSTNGANWIQNADAPFSFEGEVAVLFKSRWFVFGSEHNGGSTMWYVQNWEARSS